MFDTFYFIFFLKMFFWFFFLLNYLFIYFWLCWVFVSVRGLSLVAAGGGYSSSRCAGLSLSRPLLLRSTGSRRAGSVLVAHGPSCSAACGIFPDQGSNPCPQRWQADSQPLRHQGRPYVWYILMPLLTAVGCLNLPSFTILNNSAMNIKLWLHLWLFPFFFKMKLLGQKT